MIMIRKKRKKCVVCGKFCMDRELIIDQICNKCRAQFGSPIHCSMIKKGANLPER